MTKSVENIISDLESAILDPPSIKNSVKTSAGDVVRLDGTLWRTSPVLQKQLTKGSSYLVLDVAQTTLTDVLRAHKQGLLPTDFAALLNVLAACSHLELDILTSKCLNALLKSGNLVKREYPSEVSTGTVLRCFRVLLESPLRTVDIYEQQLARIACHCNHDRDVMTNAMNLLKQNLERFAGLNLEGMPVNFDLQKIKVVVHKRSGKLQSAIVNERELIPVDVFGKHFNLKSLDCDGTFYLKYGCYVLYSSCGRVYRKSLRDDSEQTEVLSGVSTFSVNDGLVFAVQVEGNRDSLMLWVDDASFSKIYHPGCKIERIDYNAARRILAVRLATNSKRFFKLDGGALSTLSEELKHELQELWLMPEPRRGWFDFNEVDMTEFMNLRNALVLIQTMARKNTEKPASLATILRRKLYSFFNTADPLTEAIRCATKGETVYSTRGWGLYLAENSPSFVIKHTILNAGELWTDSWLSMSSSA